jgi:hypothetical protein
MAAYGEAARLLGCDSRAVDRTDLVAVWGSTALKTDRPRVVGAGVRPHPIRRQHPDLGSAGVRRSRAEIRREGEG